MDRRGFLSAILAAGVAPAFIDSRILMPLRLVTPVMALPVFYGDGIHDDTVAMQAMLDGQQVQHAITGELLGGNNEIVSGFGYTVLVSDSLHVRAGTILRDCDIISRCMPLVTSEENTVIMCNKFTYIQPA